MKKHAFTLIELLVVIAIIAILAAILFPVFTQAKVAAKKTQELSNAKQIGLAFQIYATNSDDVSPIVSKAPAIGLTGTTLDARGKTTVAGWYALLQPYAKNWQLFLSPTRTDHFDPAGSKTGDPFKCYDNMNPTGTCLGFGYNDGLVSDTGYGILGTQTTDAYGYTLRPGRSLTSFENPADMTAFGSSNDNPGYSIAMDNILSRYPDNISTKAIRYGGQFLFGFADGHAKMIQMRAGEYPNYGLVSIPANKNDAYKWCWSQSFIPDSTFDGGNSNPAGSGDYPLQSNVETCAQAVDDLYTNTVVNP